MNEQRTGYWSYWLALILWVGSSFSPAVVLGQEVSPQETTVRVVSTESAAPATEEELEDGQETSVAECQMMPLGAPTAIQLSDPYAYCIEACMVARDQCYANCSGTPQQCFSQCGLAYFQCVNGC